MKIIIFGGLLFALAHAQEKSKDSSWRFEWVKNELGSQRTNSDDLLIQIRIPPIRERLYARLRPYNPIASKSLLEGFEGNHCIFEGRLENDPESYVTVTGGCPGEDSFEILIRSKEFLQSRFIVRNGIGTPVTLPSLGQSQQQSIELKPPEDNFEWKGTSRAIMTPPPYLTMNISLYYDQSFKNRFGASNIQSVMISIIAQVQNLFFSTSNLYRIRLLVNSLREVNVSMQANRSSLGLAAYRVPDKLAHTNVFLTSSSLQPSTLSIAYVGTVCSKYAGYRTSISEFYQDNITTASIVAHSIGHSLGMYNDFVTGNFTGRNSSQGYPCTNIRSIMEPGWNGVVWSICSMEDFAKYYTTIMQTKGKFCLPRDTGIDGNWGSWYDVDSCTATSPKKLQRRFCDSPSPQFGGANCSGCNLQVVFCNTSTSLRFTALDVLTNTPITPPASIAVFLNYSSPIYVTSPGVISNVAFNTPIVAAAADNSHLLGAVGAAAEDIFNDGIMDITIALSPQMGPNQMRMVLMWGEGDVNLDLHGVQYNFTDGSTCHAYTGNRQCSGMTYHLDNIGRGPAGGEAITITSSYDLVFGFYVSNPRAFNNSDANFNFLPSNYDFHFGAADQISSAHYWVIGCVLNQINFTLADYGIDVDPQTALMQTCRDNYPPNGWSEWTGVTPCSQTCGLGTQARTRNCLIPTACQGCSLDIGPCQIAPCNTGVSLRLTALDAMTNAPIIPPPIINTFLPGGNPIILPSPAVVPNAVLGDTVFAYVGDSNHLTTTYLSSVQDVFNDQIMDITLVMSPRLIENQMRIAIMWGENEFNLDLHGIQYNLTDGTTCHAFTGNRRCSGMWYNLDNVGSGPNGGEVITFGNTNDLLYGFYVSNPDLFNNSAAYYNFWPNNQNSVGSSAFYLPQVHYWVLGCVLSTTNFSLYSYGSDDDPTASLMELCRNTLVTNTWSDWAEMTPCSHTCGAGTQLRTRQCLAANGCQGCDVQVANCNVQPCGGVTLRITALDVLTNGPIATPVLITSYIDSMNRTSLPSPAIIPNVPVNASIVALALDDMQIQPHLPAVFFGRVKGTGLMNLTIMMGPQLNPGQMRIILGWGQGDVNLDLHGIQYNYTDGSVCHAFTGNRRCSGMTYNLDNVGRGSDGGEAITFDITTGLLFGFYVSNPNVFIDSDAYVNLHISNNFNSVALSSMNISQGHFWVIGCVLDQTNFTLSNIGTDFDPQVNLIQTCRNTFRPGDWSQWSPVTPCSQTCGYGTQARTRNCLLATGCQGCSIDVAQCQIAPCNTGLGVTINVIDVMTNIVVNPPVMIDVFSANNFTQGTAPIFISNVPPNSQMTANVQDERFLPTGHMFKVRDDYGNGRSEVAVLMSPYLNPDSMRLILGWGQGAVALTLYALQYNSTDGTTCLTSSPSTQCSGMFSTVQNFGRGSWGGQAITLLAAPELTYAFYASIPGTFNNSGAYIRIIQSNLDESTYFTDFYPSDGSFWKIGCIDGSTRTLSIYYQFNNTNPQDSLVQSCFGNLNPIGWGQWSPITECTQQCGSGTQVRTRTCYSAAGCPGCSLQVSSCQSQCLKLQAVDVTTLSLALNSDPNLQISINGTNKPLPVSVAMPPAGTDLTIMPTHPNYENYVKDYVVRGSTTAAILMSPKLNPGTSRIVLGWGQSISDLDLMAVEISIADQQICTINFSHKNCNSASLLNDYLGSGDLGGEVITFTNATSYIYGIYTALSTVDRDEASFTYFDGRGSAVYGDLRNAQFGPELFWSIGCVHGPSNNFVPINSMGSTNPRVDLRTTCVNLFNNGVWSPWSASTPCSGPTSNATQVRTRQCLYPGVTSNGCIGCNISIGSCSGTFIGDCIPSNTLTEDKPTFKPIILNPSG